jgi:hypothetical protein
MNKQVKILLFIANMIKNSLLLSSNLDFSLRDPINQ